jgi:hypothetical protein
MIPSYRVGAINGDGASTSNTNVGEHLQEHSQNPKDEGEHHHCRELDISDNNPVLLKMR